MMNKRKSKSGVAADADGALLERLREGDETALSALYDARSSLVYSLALSIVRNSSDAEEVTQEVFYRVWQKAAVFDRARGSALAWLTTMTRRLAIDRTRSKQFRSGAREMSLEMTADASAGRAVAGKQENGVAAREVHSALGRLNRPHREIIELSYFEGLSHSKIADHLGAPLGTVKSRLREAVKQLRRALDVEV